MFFWQWWCSDDLNRAINEEEFIDYQVFVYPTDSSGVGTSKLLRCLEPWAYPFFSKLQMMALIGKVWTMTFHILFPFRILLFLFSFAPSKEIKRVHVSTFPQKKMSKKLPFKKIVAFAVNSVGVGSPHHLSSWPWRLSPLKSWSSFSWSTAGEKASATKRREFQGGGKDHSEGISCKLGNKDSNSDIPQGLEYDVGFDVP